MLLTVNGCASSIKYSSFPDSPNCNISFEVVEVGRPSFDELPPEYLRESTLNGSVRRVVLKHNNQRILLIVDPEFPTNEFDRWANNNLTARLNTVGVGDDFPLECEDYKRITTIPNSYDGVYFDEIN